MFDGFGCRVRRDLVTVSIMGNRAIFHGMLIVCVVTAMCGVSDMLTVFHGVNDRAGTHEQQRLEEGVRDQVEGSGDIGTDAERGDHETKLADR